MALNLSHNSSAAVIRNGEIVVAVCEERSRRKKNFSGYPKHAVDYCLEKAGILGCDLARVAYTTMDNSGLFTKAQTVTEFTLADYRDYYGARYFQRGLRGEDLSEYKMWLRDAPQFQTPDETFDFSYLTDEVLAEPAREASLFQRECARVLSAQIGLPIERIEFLDHHTCHAHYAYFGSPFRGKDCIVLTFDGWGDGRNQTVWHVRDERFTLLADSSQNDLGRIYKFATLILGMRPDEHEFKVMGLAPYAKASYADRAMVPLVDLCTVDGMRIVSKNRPSDLFTYLEEAWKTHRFDNIAAAVQNYTEHIACELVRNIVRETGIRRIVLGGGIAMNIKMNKAISELDEVDELFVCGSNGDESLSIGGCYLLNDTPEHNKPLGHLYLGYDIADEFERFDPDAYVDRYVVTRDVTFDHVASLIADGDILGVVRGRAEFGARALGNRSILADPSRRNSVQKINEAIKNRDFWMPFALSILEEHHQDYILNPKGLSSPFMAISLDVRPGQHSRIEAGTHPYDLTVRPQFVSMEQAPEYHNLIRAFQRLTDIPALLNTSFNLHGEPIVDTIADAVRTFELSGLDHLFIQDQVLLSKRPRGEAA